MSNRSTRPTSPRTMLGRCRPPSSNSLRRNKGRRKDAMPMVSSIVTSTALDHSHHSRRSTLLIPARTEGTLSSRSRNAFEDEAFIDASECNSMSHVVSGWRFAKRRQTKDLRGRLDKGESEHASNASASWKNRLDLGNRSPHDPLPAVAPDAAQSRSTHSQTAKRNWGKDALGKHCA